MSQVGAWTEWRERNLETLDKLSKQRPRDMRLKARIKDFKAANGEEIERLGLIIAREYRELGGTNSQV